MQSDAALIDASGDVALHDGGAEVEAEASVSRCQACLTAPDQPGPGCATELAACKANAECAAAMACAFAKACFDRGSLSALISCGYPCAVEAGITLTDPAINLAYNLFQCAGKTCGVQCQLVGD